MRFFRWIKSMFVRKPTELEAIATLDADGKITHIRVLGCNDPLMGEAILTAWRAGPGKVVTASRNAHGDPHIEIEDIRGEEDDSEGQPEIIRHPDFREFEYPEGGSDGGT